MPLSHFKSHPPLQVLAAIRVGKSIWYFDAKNGRDNDYLIAYPDEPKEDIVQDILLHHDRDTWPEEWELTLLSTEDAIASLYSIGDPRIDAAIDSEDFDT